MVRGADHTSQTAIVILMLTPLQLLLQSVLTYLDRTYVANQRNLLGTRAVVQTHLLTSANQAMRGLATSTIRNMTMWKCGIPCPGIHTFRQFSIEMLTPLVPAPPFCSRILTSACHILQESHNPNILNYDHATYIYTLVRLIKLLYHSYYIYRLVPDVADSFFQLAATGQ